MIGARSPRISIVVPTYRRPRLLERCLRALAEQDLPIDDFEVVAVDDGSGDATAAVLDRFRRTLPNLVALVQRENRGPAAARNRGMQAASAPLLLFLDDDVVAAPGLVAEHLRLHEPRGGCRGVLGRIAWLPTLRVTPFMRWLDTSGLQFGYDTWLREGPVEPPWAAFYTANLSLPKEVVAAAGGFDERFPYAAYEDMELAWRLTRMGLRLDYRPSALAYHARPMRLTDFRARMARVARSAALLRTVQPELPLDDADLLLWARGPVTRTALALASPVARLAGAERLLIRHYKVEIAAAYARGQACAPERSGDPARSLTPILRRRPGRRHR